MRFKENKKFLPVAEDDHLSDVLAIQRYLFAIIIYY